MTTLVTPLLKMEVEDRVEVLEVLGEQIFQIFLRIFLGIWVEETDQGEIQTLIIEVQI